MKTPFDILGRNKKNDTRSRDQKIQDALKQQAKAGSPYAEDRGTTAKPVSAHSHGEERPLTARETFEARVQRHKEALASKKKRGRYKGETEHANPGTLERLNAVYGSQGKKDHQKLIHDLNTKGHNEPYYGPDIHHPVWGDQEYDLPQQFPAKATDLGGVIGKGVPTGTGPDPFAWMDSKYGVSKKLLERERGKPLDIHTRSDLIAHDDYASALTPGKHRIFIHVPSDNNDRASRVLEPGAPSVARRVTAANKLAAMGHDVTLVHDKFQHPEGKDLSSINSFNRFSMKDVLNPKVKLQENHVPLSSKGAANLSRVLGEDFGTSVPQEAAPANASKGASGLKVVKYKKSRLCKRQKSWFDKLKKSWKVPGEVPPMEKAKVESDLSPKGKRIIRDERRIQTKGADQLAAQQTKSPGVSKQGAAVRAGNPQAAMAQAKTRMGKAEENNAPMTCKYNKSMKKSEDGGCWYCGKLKKKDEDK